MQSVASFRAGRSAAGFGKSGTFDPLRLIGHGSVKTFPPIIHAERITRYAARYNDTNIFRPIEHREPSARFKSISKNRDAVLRDLPCYLNPGAQLRIGDSTRN